MQTKPPSAQPAFPDAAESRPPGPHHGAPTTVASTEATRSSIPLALSRNLSAPAGFNAGSTPSGTGLHPSATGIAGHPLARPSILIEGSRSGT